MPHDYLQHLCFTWFWNTYPQYRYLMHANINSHSRWRIRDLTRLKSIGLVKGVFDLEFYFNRVLYVFDIKIGKDRLTESQRLFATQIESQGGKAYEIRNFEEFKKIIEWILKK